MPKTKQTTARQSSGRSSSGGADHLTEGPSYMRSTMSSRNHEHGAASEKDERTEQRKERAAHLMQPIASNSWDALRRNAEDTEKIFQDLMDALIKKTQANTGSYTVLKSLAGASQLKPARERAERAREKADAAEAGATAPGKEVPGYMRPTLVSEARQKDPLYAAKTKSFSGAAPLKAEARSTQKATGKYKHSGGYRALLDVVRGTLTFDSFQQMIKALDTLEGLEGFSGGEFEAVRCKQTYTLDEHGSRHRTLYGDVKVNIRSKTTGHICEVQLTHMEMMKKKNAGHKPYEAFRELAPRGDESMSQMVDGGGDGAQARVTRAVHQSHAAYGSFHRLVNLSQAVTKVEGISSRKLQELIQRCKDLDGTLKERAKEAGHDSG